MRISISGSRIAKFKNMLTYDQAIEYLESFINYEKLAAPYDPRKWKLERMERLLDAIGNPHMGQNFIHIAGTKGKGSTAAMITSILNEADYKVGLYTSPHLISFRERICIDGEMISEDQVAALVTQLKPYIDKQESQSDDFGHISFFDIYTVLGILFFAQENVDFSVLEVGMGGRLDATNVVNPLVSVITQISYDHMMSLGDTLGEIAAEKAGIVKENGCVITSPQEQEALEVIRNTCAEKNARLYEVGRDIILHKDDGFSVSGIFGSYENLTVALMGDHQKINAATAIGALELLNPHEFKISAENIKAGLKNVRWPARIEVVQREPVIIVDSAHNAASAKALRDALVDNFSYEKLIFILGIAQHKDIRGMAKYLCPVADTMILTKVDNPRAVDPEDMKPDLMDTCGEVILTPNVASALEKARTMASSNDLICVTGSVYLAGEAIEALRAENV